jgi:hypothetical protein
MPRAAPVIAIVLQPNFTRVNFWLDGALRGNPAGMTTDAPD